MLKSIILVLVFLSFQSVAAKDQESGSKIHLLAIVDLLEEQKGYELDEAEYCEIVLKGIVTDQYCIIK